MATTLTQRTQEIQTLNDAFRTSFQGGRVVLTAGMQALSPDELQQVFDIVKSFTDWSSYNDPYGEHDFGSFEFNKSVFYWKIDCYDRNQINHSPDASNPLLTLRVLTILCAEEY